MKRAFLFVFLLLAGISLSDWSYESLIVSFPSSGDTVDNISFGISSEATDDYESGIDLAAPPAPPTAEPTVYIDFPDPEYGRLWRDIRAVPEPGDSIIWDFIIDPFSSSATISWPGLPEDGEFYIHIHSPGADFNWTSATDMRDEESAGIPTGNVFSILYIHPGETEDTDPPVIINLEPENGAVGVPSDTDISMDILDYDSGVDISTLEIIVMGFDISTMVTPEPITDGYSIDYSPPLELPAGSFTAMISVCDMASPPNCLDEFEYGFTVTDSDTSYFMIQGTVTDSHGSPLEDATIYVLDDTLTMDTDSTGRYLLMMPGLGTYELYATKAGYATSETTEVELTISEPFVTDIDFELEALEGYTVSGVFTLEGETGHSGININIGGTYLDTTESDGSYEITDVPVGEYVFMAIPPTSEYEYYLDTISVTADMVISGELPLIGGEESRPPSHLVAHEEILNRILLQWEAPLEGDLYEISYDDGVNDWLPGPGDGYTHIGAGANPNVEWGVEFTPPEPGCSLLVVKYDFNVHGAFRLANIHIRDMIADTPSDLLIPTFYTDIDTTEDWTEVEIGLYLEDDSDFFAGFRSSAVDGDTSAVYIGCDKSDPDMRSWLKWEDSAWDLVNYHSYEGLSETDLMIRAIVKLPDGSLCELGSDGSSRPIARGTHRRRAGNPLQQMSVAIDMPETSPFSDAEEIVTTKRTISYREPEMLAPSDILDDMEVMEYRIYRSESYFTDTSDAELIGTRGADTLWYWDDDLDEYDPYEWLYYGITAVHESGISGLSNVDSGYYVEYGDTSTEVLVVDLSHDIMYAEEESENEAIFLGDLLDDIGISNTVTPTGESFYRFPIEYYDACIVVMTTVNEGRLILLDDEVEDIIDFVDDGGSVYLEGAITALKMYQVDEPYADDFQNLFGYEHSFADTVSGTISHHRDTGNVVWMESMPDDGFFGDYYMHLNYDTHLRADWRNSQLTAAPGASVTMRSQPNTVDIPVEYSRGRVVRKNHGLGKTVFSSVYIGAMHDSLYPQQRSRVLGSIMEYFGIENDAVFEEYISNPQEIDMIDCLPNPFNSAITIDYKIEDNAIVELYIIDLFGRRVDALIDNRTMTKGSGNTIWNPKDEIASGVYTVILKTNGKIHSDRILYIK
ncbi:MAG: carboxypeptidase regulatory-like domain-containing protein [Candidatus Zixiibacteriota bacterium]